MTNQLGPYQLNQIYSGECSQMMVALPDGCIDLTVTSPPYDSLRSYSGYTFDFERIAAQLYRVTKQGGVVVWVVADETKNGSESGTSFRQALGFMAVGFNLYDTMFWEKLSRIPTEGRYYSVIEYMFVFSRGQPKTINYINDHKNVTIGARKQKDAVINKGNNQKKSAYLVTPKYSRRSNLWGYPTGQHDNYSNSHPAIFPEALARDHILSWSNPGDVVLDPMVGSGTTAKQAHLLGRHYLGFDISEEYCQLARRRVANVEAQPFLMPPDVEANGKPEQAAMFET